jgi:Fe-S-cluster containining protein
MNKKAARKLADLLAQLDALYAELPTVACRGLCAQACAAIPLTDLEVHRLQHATHCKPRTVGENRCVYLTPTERCGVYAIRPLICRAYGVVPMLSCPHGCMPDRWLGMAEYFRLAKAIERIGGGRVLRTGPNGLACTPGETYANIPVIRSPDAIAATEARTRALRALHGGFIQIALDERDE